MNFKQTLSWLIGYEVFTGLLVWMNLRSQWVDPGDGSLPPTKGQIVLMTHVYSYAFLAALIVFILIFMRVWKASNRRRR